MHDNTHLTSSQPPTDDHYHHDQGSTASGEQTQSEKKTVKTIQDSLSDLRSQIAQLEDEVVGVRGGLQENPTATVKRHIHLLHEYNEIKDVGQGLMGLIADARGVRVVEVQREFGVDDRD